MLVLHHTTPPEFHDTTNVIRFFQLFCPPIKNIRVHQDEFKLLFCTETFSIIANTDPHEFETIQRKFIEYTQTIRDIGQSFELTYYDPNEKYYGYFDDRPSNEMYKQYVKWEYIFDVYYEAVVECSDTEFFILQCAYPDKMKRIY